MSGFGNSERQSVDIDPLENQGSRAEVACHFKGTGADGAFPGNVGTRYALGRDVTVREGGVAELGEIRWTPARSGPSLWLIGVPEAGARLSLELNGKSLGKSDALPGNGVMHRDSCRGLRMERSYPVSAEMLREGGNTLKFRLDGGVWHHGLMYDCIRMEAAAAP